MDKQVKKREWVKTAAIIFLAVLLALTFFSNTIMNRTLPEVSTAQVTDGNISAKVRGTGIVSAIGNTDIKSPATTIIASVKVKSGQEVNSGDVLFILGEQSDELTAAEEELSSLQFQLQRYKNSYPNYYSSSTDANIASYKNAMDAAESEYEEAKRQYKDYLNLTPEQLTALEKAVSDARDNLTSTQLFWDIKISDLEKEYNAAVLSGDDSKIIEAQDNLNKGRIISEHEIAEIQNELSLCEAKLDSARRASSEVFSASAKYESAKYAYQSAIDSSNSAYETYNKSVQSATIDIQETQDKISKLQQRINELKGGEGSGGITAPVGGIISSVAATAGMSVAKGDLLCTIEVPDQGFQITFSVTNDQAKRLKVGDTATISNFYWGSEITATVSSIAADSKNPQTNKSITCDLEGDVNSGDSLTVSIGSKSANYDTVVPKSAVRTDSNGTYVLMVESKNSALGNRYYARRVDVEQLATDDVNVAVNGNLNYGDFVITTSSEPVSGNTQVRMADNN